MDEFGNNFASGLGGILGGLFGNSGQPYQDAFNAYQPYANKGIQAQNPFFNAGAGAIPGYQQWLSKMQNPSGFINNLMNQYQESPYAKYQQQQNINASNNLGSATGLTGSTPLQLQAQQNAQNISSGDMQNWLGNVLGINSQVGEGYGNLIGYGQNAANALSNMYGQMGQNAGAAAYGQTAGNNFDFGNLLGGGLELGASLFGL